MYFAFEPKLCLRNVLSFSVNMQSSPCSLTEMLNKVDPLRQELRTLEESAETTRIKGEEIEKIVTELERSINK